MKYKERLANIIIHNLQAKPSSEVRRSNSKTFQYYKPSIIEQSKEFTSQLMKKLQEAKKDPSIQNSFYQESAEQES